VRAWNDRRIVPRSVSRSHSKAVKTLIRQACWLLAAVLCANNAYALYDPPPDAALDAVQGEWQGTLTYRDYRPSVLRGDNDLPLVALCKTCHNAVHAGDKNKSWQACERDLHRLIAQQDARAGKVEGG